MKQLVLFLLIFPLFGNNQNLYVNNTRELIDAFQKAKPGTVILLNDGKYDGKLVFDKMSGTRNTPITIKAASKGKAEVHSKFEIKGDFIHVEGLTFVENGSLELLGKKIRVSHCKWDDSKSKKWLRVGLGSSLIEIDHNTFQNKNFNSKYPKGCQLLQIVVSNKNERHHIHHNLFKNIVEGSGNGFETIQLITDKNPFNPPPGSSNSIIEDNYFERANGEAEIISIKSNGNTIRRNIFKKCKGSLVLRHGDNNTVSSNFFFGTHESKGGGIRIQGSGHLISNNYFQDLGSFGIGMMDGTPDELYVRVSDVQILHNTFVNCNDTFQIGINHSKYPNGSTPMNCIVEGNVFFFEREDHDDAVIKFVKDDIPVGWSWKNNLSFGRKSPEISGIDYINPNFTSSENGLWVPSRNTPSTSFIDSDKTSSVEVDIFGRKRKKKRTLGAIQFSKSKQKEIIVEESYGADYY
jgi:poly(beta-D-mannuronate) lyase